MTKLNNIWFGIITCSILLSACRKDQSISTTDSFTIINDYQQALFVNIYENQSGYDKNMSGYKFVVPGNGSLRISYPPFEEGKTYLVDWYSKDYLHTNWHNKIESFQRGAGSGEFRLQINNTNAETYKIAARAAWLNGTMASTRWKTIEIFGRSASGGYVPISKLLNENQRLFEIELNKNLTATTMRKNDAGELQSVSYTYQPSYLFPTDVAILLNEKKEQRLRLQSNFSNVAGYYSTATDTMLATYTTDTLTFYKMIRI